MALVHKELKGGQVEGMGRAAVGASSAQEARSRLQGSSPGREAKRVFTRRLRH
jgi:hypothetical protein